MSRSLASVSTAVLMCFAIATSTPASAEGYVEIIKLTTPDLEPTDEFGRQVAVDGDVVAIGSDFWFVGTGAVWIFERNEGGSNQWGPTARLLGPEPRVGDQFGHRIALDGDTLVVASFDEVPDAFHVFERVGRGDWDRVATINDVATGTIAIHEDRIAAAGAFFTDDAFKVFIHERGAGGPNNWGRVATLDQVGEPRFFGDSIAIHGDTVVVGATEDGPSQRGSAFVWERDGSGDWQEVANLLASDGAEDDQFGFSVSVEGDLIAVSAPNHDLPEFNAGATYLFRRDETLGWSEVAKLSAIDAEVGDAAGYAVSIDVGRVTIGAHSREHDDLRAVGSAFVFEETSPGVWSQTAEIRAGDEEEFDIFGKSLETSAGAVVVGATGDDEQGLSTGAAYVFQLVAMPTVALSGSCPGEMLVEVLGGTPSGPLAVVGGRQEGSSVVPSGPCAGLDLGLEDPILIHRTVLDSEGHLELFREVGDRYCGAFFQVVDMVTCGAGEASQSPFRGE